MLRPLALVAFAAATVAATPSPETPVGGFGQRVDVEVVNVDVLVTDRDGRPIRDLRQDDFVLRVDGKVVPIEYFAAPASAASAAGAPLAASPSAATAVSSAPAPASVVIYVDASAMTPSTRRAALNALESFVEDDLPPGADVTVAGFDRNLRIVAGPTTDPKAIRRALAEVGKFAVSSSTRSSEALVAEIGALRFTDAFVAENLRVDARVLAEQQAQLQRLGFQALRDLLGTLSAVEGRKLLVLASGGFQTAHGARLDEAWRESFGAPAGEPQEAGGDISIGSSGVSLRSELSRLLRSAQASGITVYALDGGDDAGGANAASADAGAVTSLGLGMEAMDRSASLRGLAAATGGRTFRVTPNLAKALPAMTEELGAAYSLGFSNGDESDAFHRLTVETRRSDLEVRHRLGFRRRSDAELLLDSALAAVAKGGGENTLAIRLALDPTLPTENRDVKRVPFIVRVPLRGLTLLPGVDGHTGGIAFQFVLCDEDNRVTTLEPRRQDLQVPNSKLEWAQGQDVTYAVAVPLRAGEYRLAVAVRDEVGGSRSVALLPFTVARR